MAEPKITLEGNALHIVVDVSPQAVAGARISSTGKTKLVASTSTKIVTPNGTLKIGLNVMAPIA